VIKIEESFKSEMVGLLARDLHRVLKNLEERYRKSFSHIHQFVVPSLSSFARENRFLFRIGWDCAHMNLSWSLDYIVVPDSK